MRQIFIEIFIVIGSNVLCFGISVVMNSHMYTFYCRIHQQESVGYIGANQKVCLSLRGDGLTKKVEKV